MPSTSRRHAWSTCLRRLPLRGGWLLLLPLLPACAGCATLRVTDPPRTADEQFLQSVAISRAIERLSFVSLRDKLVFVDVQYIYDSLFPTAEQIFLVGELRNRLLIEGAALTEQRGEAEVIVEVRSGAVGVNRSDFLLGFPG